MRVVLTTFGSLGDLHPYLAIALELKRRGHRPLLATSELYRARIEGEGVEFRAVRPDLPEGEAAKTLAARVMDGHSGPRWLFRHLMMPPLRETHADLMAACAAADILISHPITFAAPIVAAQLNLPWLATVLSPISFWSLHDPSLPPTLGRCGEQTPRLGRPVNWLLREVARGVTRRWLRPVAQLRRDVGLNRGGHPLFEGGYSPHGTLALFSRALAAPQPDWPPAVTQCGFCFYDRDAESIPTSLQSTLEPQSASELSEFLASGAPPLVFTLGSAAVWTARDFWLQSHRATELLKRRAVYLVGDLAQWPADLRCDERHFVAAYAPYSQLFARAAVVVHQGGIGTTGQALAAGRPQLIVPFSHDQPDNAARIARLGSGRTLRRPQYQWQNAARELAALSDDAKYFERAQTIAAALQKENGPRTACDAIEALAP